MALCLSQGLDQLHPDLSGSPRGRGHWGPRGNAPAMESPGLPSGFPTRTWPSTWAGTRLSETLHVRAEQSFHCRAAPRREGSGAQPWLAAHLQASEGGTCIFGGKEGPFKEGGVDFALTCDRQPSISCVPSVRKHKALCGQGPGTGRERGSQAPLALKATTLRACTAHEGITTAPFGRLAQSELAAD